MVGLLSRIRTVNQKKRFCSVSVARDRGEMHQRYHGSCVCHAKGSQLVRFVTNISYDLNNVLTTAHLIMCLFKASPHGYLCA